MNDETVNVLATDRWLSLPAPDCDVVLMTGALLLRNVDGLRFPTSTKHTRDWAYIADMARTAANENGLIGEYWPNGNIIEIQALTDSETRFLFENKQISPDMITGELPEHRLVLSDGQGVESVSVNDCDHFQCRALLPGWQPFAAHGRAARVENELAQRINGQYAFNDKLGYLTAEPAAAGTGLVINVFLHLPGLLITRKIKKIKKIAEKHGVDLRPYTVWPDNSIFVAQNQYTIGHTEDQIVMNINETVEGIIDLERQMRLDIRDEQNQSVILSDQICRAIAICRQCRLLEWRECLALLLAMRLAIAYGINRTATQAQLNQLLFQMQPHHVALQAGFEHPELDDKGVPIRSNERIDLLYIDRWRATALRRISKQWRIVIPPEWK